MADADDLLIAIEEVRDAVEGVKNAVASKGTATGAVVFVFVLIVVLSWIDSAWHSKFRYSTQYSLPETKVTVQPMPHDCNFLASPLGAKYCSYEPVPRVVYWATSTTGGPIESYDEGKTWSTFTPDAGVKVPQYKTAESLYLSWEKKDD